MAVNNSVFINFSINLTMSYMLVKSNYRGVFYLTKGLCNHNLMLEDNNQFNMINALNFDLGWIIVLNNVSTKCIAGRLFLFRKHLESFFFIW